jgi:hypothetical protein
MESNINCNDDVFSKFINRAKKKLSKIEDFETKTISEKSIIGEYIFEKSNKNENYKKLEDKVKSLLNTDPDTPYPIDKLIYYKVFNKLDSSAKERYILQLSNDYVKIKSSLIS